MVELPLSQKWKIRFRHNFSYLCHRWIMDSVFIPTICSEITDNRQMMFYIPLNCEPWVRWYLCWFPCSFCSRLVALWAGALLAGCQVTHITNYNRYKVLHTTYDTYENHYLRVLYSSYIWERQAGHTYNAQIHSLFKLTSPSELASELLFPTNCVQLYTNSWELDPE